MATPWTAADDDEPERRVYVTLSGDDDSSEEEWHPTVENADDSDSDDDENDDEAGDSDADDADADVRVHDHDESEEPEDEEGEEQDEEESVEVWVPSAAAEIRNVLPPEVRSTVERVFAGQTFMPMRFVKTEFERRQQKLLLDERIAHQLKSYETDDVHSAPLAVQRRSKNGRSRQMFYALAQREQCGRNSKAQLIKLQDTFLPFQQHKHCKSVDYVGERLYCGGFNSTGTKFLVAGQLPHVLIYDTINWKRHSLLPAREVQWTVTDAKFTPDDQHVLYSSITSNVRMVDVDFKNTRREEVFSIIRPLGRSGSADGDLGYRYRSRCGVWCIDVNASGTEFVAGTSNKSVVLYDMQTKTAVCHVEGHTDDVNAIAFVDGPLHSNVFVSGSDDALIKLWDRRVLSESNPKPQGVFPGHIDGITYISSRDDGYYFLSNSKDQTAKLWDLRKCLSAAQHDRLPHFRKPHQWDYRYQDFPGLRKLPVSHPNDKSVMTYRGHLVMETLVRAHFSPLHTTGQKYIFSGSADGRVYVYDTLSGDLVEIFAMKPDGLTRDVRWHPFEPTIVSPDFYGKLCVWQRQE